MPACSIVDVLTDTEHWLHWTGAFGPLSGFAAQLTSPRQRYVTTTLCYGCYLGPTQTARSMPGFDRFQVAYVNQRHITEQKLLDASVSVINRYNRFHLPSCGGRASARPPMARNGTSTNTTCSVNITFAMVGGEALATTTCPTPILPCSVALLPAASGKPSTFLMACWKTVGDSPGHPACRYPRAVRDGFWAGVSVGDPVGVCAGYV